MRPARWLAFGAAPLPERTAGQWAAATRSFLILLVRSLLGLFVFLPAKGNRAMTSDETRVCKIHNCKEPVSRRFVVLLNPDGSEHDTAERADRRYCERHTDQLLGNLRKTYTGGGPALRVDVLDG